MFFAFLYSIYGIENQAGISSLRKTGLSKKITETARLGFCEASVSTDAEKVLENLFVLGVPF
jgi:hypothetical protein